MKTLFAIAAFFTAVLTLVNPLSAQTWTKTGAPALNWGSIACSADGSIAAGASGAWQGLYTSTNSGTTYSKSFDSAWVCVALSADGHTLFGGQWMDAGNALEYSTDAGMNWASNSTISHSGWNSLACSGDGTKAIGATRGGICFFGVPQQTNPATYAGWQSVACSADFRKLVALTSLQGGIYTSTNTGLSWNQADAPTNGWGCVVSSSDGTKLAAMGRYAQFYFSTNSGATWKTNSTPVNGARSLASSADGSLLVAASGYTGYVSISTNFGNTWTKTASPLAVWSSVAVSADGGLIYAAQPSGLWVSQTIRPPRLKITNRSSNVVLSWIVPSTPLVLQQSSDFTTKNWETISNTPILNPDTVEYEVKLPAPTNSTFFRLKTQ